MGTIAVDTRRGEGGVNMDTAAFHPSVGVDHGPIARKFVRDKFTAGFVLDVWVEGGLGKR